MDNLDKIQRRYEESNRNNQDADYGLIANNSDENRTVHLRHGGTITFDRPLTVREKVNAVEALMKQQPQVQLATKHYFSKGVYAREITIPAGTILTGHIHKYPNLNIISKGKIEVLVDNDLVIIEAPATIVSPAGTKRIARALEDTVWTTIHGTNETDVEKIEQEFIAHTEAEYLEHEKQLPLPLIDRYPILKRELGM